MIYKLLLPLSLLCTTFSSHAEERWFEVELLLFQRNAPINSVAENLARDDLQVNTNKSIPLLKVGSSELCTSSDSSLCLYNKIPVLINSQQFASQANGFQFLDNSHLQLTPQRLKLDEHGTFKPLLHLVWRMPVKSRYSAKPIHLVAGMDNTNTVMNVTTPMMANSDQQLSATSGQTQVAVNSSKWTIDGNFKVYLDHYLYIDSQLLIHYPVTQDVIVAGNNEPQFETINSDSNVQVIKQNERIQQPTVQQKTVIKEALFDQNRRLRSGEIHYFDHPLMGMIVQIRKIPEE